MPAAVPDVAVRLAAGSAVVAAKAIEGDHAVMFGGSVEQAGGDEILGVDTVAVQEHQDRAAAALQIVQAHAVDLDELALRRMFPFRLAGFGADVGPGSQADAREYEAGG